MKNFLLQNVVRADIFSGSLAVFSKERGEPEFYEGEPQITGACFRPSTGSGRNTFELFSIYTASQDLASG